MPIDQDDGLARLLHGARRIAVVGASDRPDRPSHGVMRALIDANYTVIPVNPRLAGGSILGQPVQASLAEVAAPIDIVDIFRNSADAGGAVDEAIAAGAGAVWMQLGIVNEAAAARAEAAGLAAVMDRCLKIEVARLADRDG